MPKPQPSSFLSRTAKAASCLLTVCTASFSAGTLFADAPGHEAIDALFAEYDSTQVPGCALGIYRGGSTIYSRGYGMANLEYGIAIAPDTVFRMASVSKQFVAAAIALLDEAGELDLDNPVQKFFPNLPDYGTPVTVRHLIYHTSGIRDYLELAWLADWGEWYRTDEALRLIERQNNLNFTPGTEFTYSNSGYLMLAEIVHRVTGQTLREWAAENMFEPLGMHQSHFHDDHTHLVPRRADGYAPGPNNESADSPQSWRISMTQLDMVGDGGLYSTVNDLQHWQDNFADNQLGKGRQALIEMLEISGETQNGESTDYGFGLGLDDYMGTPEISHGGAFVGYRTAINRYPEIDLSIAVLCNRSDAGPSRLAREVAALYLAASDKAAPEPYQQAMAASDEVQEPSTPSPSGITLTDAQRQVHAGTYWNQDLKRRRLIVVEEGNLYYDRDGWSRSQLIALSADRFKMADVGSSTEVVFTGDAARVFVEGQDELIFERYDPESLSTPSLESIAGTYYSEELDHFHRLSVVDGQLMAARRSGSEVMEPLPGDQFISDGVVFRIERDEDNAVTGFMVHSGRVTNLIYERRAEEGSAP